MSASAARPPCHPAKENPDAAYHAGAQEQAAPDGRIVSGRLRDWNNNTAPCPLISASVADEV